MDNKSGGHKIYGVIRGISSTKQAQNKGMDCGDNRGSNHLGGSFGDMADSMDVDWSFELWGDTKLPWEARD